MARKEGLTRTDRTRSRTTDVAIRRRWPHENLCRLTFFVFSLSALMIETLVVTTVVADTVVVTCVEVSVNVNGRVDVYTSVVVRSSVTGTDIVIRGSCSVVVSSRVCV